MAMPVTRYAKSGDVHIAYQVFGSGPIDLVFVPGFVSHIENYWDHPDLARWLLRLSSFARVAIFDKRGTGLSDRVAEAPSLDQRMDDARAVMDAAGMERAALLGISEGGPLATLFAATYPQRCQALVLYGTFARSSWITPEGLQAFLEYIGKAWGTGRSLRMWAPSHRDDPALKQWWGRFERLGASPAAALAVKDDQPNRYQRYSVLGPCANSGHPLHRGLADQRRTCTLPCRAHSGSKTDRDAGRRSSLFCP